MPDPSAPVEAALVAADVRETQENEALFRRLADSIPQLAWMAHPDGWIFWYNRRWYEYTGSTPELMAGWGWQSVHDPIELPRVTERWRASIATGNPFEMTFPLLGADGRFRPFLTRVVPVLDTAGRVERWFGTNTDVTAQLEVEAELERRVQERTAELEARTAALSAFAEFTEAVATESDVPALAGRAVEVVERALGADAVAYYEREGNLWRARAVSAGTDPVTRAVALAGLPADMPLFAAARLEPTFIEGGAMLESAPEAVVGEVVREYAAAAAVPVVADGALRGLLVAGLKAGRFWQERDRAVVRAVARGLVVALERAQATGRLASQKRELEERAAEQETFVYTVSHDLRQPLLAMQGMTELLDEAVALGDAQEASFTAGRVRANLARMGRLLDDLLALSRVGRAGAPTEVVDLGDVMLTTMAELVGRIEARGAIVDRPAAWPRVVYPRSEAEQVVANLVGNALKWAGRPGETPRIRLSCVVRGRLVELRVEDNGPGVPPAYREKVFALFQKLDATSEGTGVGLAIVKRIAERNGGRAWVEDSELGGASFVVTLPAERRERRSAPHSGHERRRA